jgi:hypothetical protein
VRLKIAEHKDEPFVTQMALKFYAESPYRGIPIDNKKVTNVIEHLMGSDLCLVLLLVSDRDEPVGMIAGHVNEMIFSTDRMASEVVWWVDPEYRGTKHSLSLLDGFEYWAFKSGCKYVQMSSLGGPKSGVLDRLYSKRKYINTEQAYVKEF